MRIRQRLQEDLQHAMKNREKRLVSALRLLMAALKQREIDSGCRQDFLDDAVAIEVLTAEAKKRREAVAQYEDPAVARTDLAEIEQYELSIIERYLPPQMNEEQITAEIMKVVDDLGVSGLSDLGRVMSSLKAKLAGRADLARVASLVKSMLAGM